MVNGALVPTDAQKVKTKTPSVAAMIFWLKNRKPKEWRDMRGKQDEEGDSTDSMGVVGNKGNVFILLPPKRDPHTITVSEKPKQRELIEEAKFIELPEELRK
jgi:hypothetical protein